MSSLSQFAGGALPPKNIVNAYSTNGYTLGANDRSDAIALSLGAKSITSGALTAATLATVLSVTGSGVIDYLSVWKMDATSRTVRVQVTIDGVICFDSTSAAGATAATGPTVLGSSQTGSYAFEPVPFKQSLVVKIASSLTETDKLSIGYKYWTV
jgi:hypothetical protein